MNQQGYPQQQQPPPKKGMSGCMIAALIVGGLGLIVVVVGGIVCWKIGKAGMEMAQEGLNAPGAAELKTAGCDVGMVMDMNKFMGSFGVDASSADATIVVSCNVNAGKAVPTCDDIAKTYVKAVTKASGKFMSQVQVQGKTKPECQKVYDETGKFIKDMPHH